MTLTSGSEDLGKLRGPTLKKEMLAKNTYYDVPYAVLGIYPL